MDKPGSVYMSETADTFPVPNPHLAAAEDLDWKVSDVMTSRVQAVEGDADPKGVAGLMREENVGLVPVVDGERRVIGCITDRDLVVRAMAPESRGDAGATAIRDLMTTDVACVTMDQPLDDVLDIMGQRQIRRVPVIDGARRLVGIVSLSDIALRAERDERLQDALSRISQPAASSSG